MPSAPPPRTTAERLADTRAMLTARHGDVWVASAGLAGDRVQAHLVPLSFAWVDDLAVIAVSADSVTARNITANGQARLALGPSRDVVMVDAELAGVCTIVDAPGDLADAYAAQSDWDPRGSDGYSYLTLRPVRIQAWREANEIAGRTLMRDGMWVTDAG